jgi:hypothetical protein
MVSWAGNNSDRKRTISWGNSLPTLPMPSTPGSRKLGQFELQIFSYFPRYLKLKIDSMFKAKRTLYLVWVELFFRSKENSFCNKWCAFSFHEPVYATITTSPECGCWKGYYLVISACVIDSAVCVFSPPFHEWNKNPLTWCFSIYCVLTNWGKKIVLF